MRQIKAEYLRKIQQYIIKLIFFLPFLILQSIMLLYSWRKQQETTSRCDSSKSPTKKIHNNKHKTNLGAASQECLDILASHVLKSQVKRDTEIERERELCLSTLDE